MNYRALIQNRKSFRQFQDRKVSTADIEKVQNHYDRHVRRLIPEIKTELLILGVETRDALEGAAGYNQFLVGAPQYLVLLSEEHPRAYLNAGFIMEDLILKLTEMDLNSCWLTFADGADACGIALWRGGHGNHLLLYTDARLRCRQCDSQRTLSGGKSTYQCSSELRCIPCRDEEIRG